MAEYKGKAERHQRAVRDEDTHDSEADIREEIQAQREEQLEFEAGLFEGVFEEPKLTDGFDPYVAYDRWLHDLYGY